MESELETKFLAIGLDQKVVKSTLKNKKLSTRLTEVIATAGITECDKAQGNLLYKLASEMPEILDQFTKLVTD